MAIFGGILYLPFKSGTIVFVAVLVVFTVFEGLLHILEVECNKHGLKGLIKKMYREFMILGFISFAILLATELSEFKTNIWYDAFHFAHIVLLFVGFVFLIQSGLLSALVRYRNRALLSHDKSSSEELIIDYVAMHNRGGLMKFLFNFGPISIPIPELREKIEYKIIQEFFVRNYNLPPEFKFANYMCGVLRHYVISLVEVRPISWIILACFVCLNLFRIEVIDPIYARGVCERYPAKNLHLGSHRTLMSVFATTDDVQHAQDLAYGRHVCQEYLLRYTFVLLFFISFYVVGVLVASEVYIQRLIGKVLDQEETIEWLEDEEHRTQQQALLAQQTQGQENFQDTDGYVDLHHLPDDSFAAANPQRSAAKENSSAGGAGIELMKTRATPQTSQESNPSNGVASGAASGATTGDRPLGVRRMSTDELSELPPTTPVYGAANVRRLTAMHRRNSAKGDDFMNMAMEPRENAHTPYSPHVTSPHRLSGGGNGKSQLPLALDLESGFGAEESTKANANAPAAAVLPPPRRLASHHRMGSLRDEILQIEAESGVRRLQPHHRQGSLRSEVSENYSTKHNEANETKLVGARNRRFLYLRCLERIMHVEFDFHANEARRVGQQEQVHSPTGPGYSNGSTYAALPAASGSEKSAGVSGLQARRNVRGNSAQQAGGPGALGLVNPAHTPHASSQPSSVQPRELIAGHRVRTHSNNSSLQDSHNGSHNGGHAPSHTSELELMHTDMRSNFQLMKDLRAEMLQEERKANMVSHLSPVPESTSTRSKFFGSLTPNAHSMSFRARSEMPPPPPKLVSTMSMDFELGGPAVRELHQMEIARGIDEDFEASKAQEKEKKKKKKSHKKKEKFSLTYAAPASPGGVINRHSSKTFQERQYEHMSLCGKFYFNLRNFVTSSYHHMLSALMGHHIGEEEPEVDADVADLQEDFTHIFLFSSAELYYFCVEFSLLAQCVYLALWATNFVFIANDSYYPVLWNIALLVPVPINFLFTKQIIFTSVMLKSIVTLDKYVSDKICEEAVDERNVKHRVRKVIRSALRTLEIPRDNWLQFTRDQFELYIPDHDEGLNIANLKLFLHSLQIFLTDNTVKRIFTVLDFDKDGTLVWEEIMPIVFPELVRKQVKVNKKKRRASTSFDFHIEGELVTTEEKKEVQRKSRQQRRASLLPTSTHSMSLSDPSEKSARIPTPDTTLPTPTPHTADDGELKSDVSDYGDDSSDSSFNSHDDISSDEENEENEEEHDNGQRSAKPAANNAGSQFVKEDDSDGKSKNVKFFDV